MPTFIRVDPKGTYLEPAADMAASPATEVSFVRYGIRPGDYLGLRCVGTFKPGQAFEPVNGLTACFYAFGVGGPVFPGKYGLDVPAVTQPTWPVQLPTDIPQDFWIPPDRTLIVRVPAGSTRLLLSGSDTYFGDNFDNEGDFGALLTMPNRSQASPGQARLAPVDAGTRDGSEEPEYSEEAIASLRAALGENARQVADWPEATTFAASQVAVEASDATRPQFRGWYLRSGWNPANSRFNADGVGSRKHGGWDIFAPRGSKLIAPVGPCWVEWMPNICGFGNIAVFRFRKDGQKYTAIYAHCDQFLLDGSRRVEVGTEVALVGCTGNASAENCGIDFESGGRSDHVHLALFEGDRIGGPNPPVDPVRIFAWTPLVPD